MGIGATEFHPPIVSPPVSPTSSNISFSINATSPGSNHSTGYRSSSYNSQSSYFSTPSTPSTPSSPPIHAKVQEAPTFRTLRSVGSSISLSSSNSSSSTSLSTLPYGNYTGKDRTVSNSRAPPRTLSHRASQPVLVSKSTDQKSNQKRRSSVNSKSNNPDIDEPIQYPSTSMFTVQTILASVNSNLPQLYENSLEFVEVCDSYFHQPEHLSPDIVLNKKRREHITGLSRKE
ncbi:hypothetical protein V1511DRAFT_485377 [Dipodascopsis uninucleata]